MLTQLDELKCKYANAIAPDIAAVSDRAIGLFDSAKKCVKGICHKGTCVHAGTKRKTSGLTASQIGYAESVIAHTPMEV